MLDFGWPELFLIVAVAVLVIGPDEIPVVMVTLGRIMRRLHYIKFAISQQFDDVMRDADLDGIRNSVNFEARDADGKELVFDEGASDDDHTIIPEPSDEQEGKKDE
tara:strand:- start:3473 stop:3790 length:318 start_codon:yes stop_codon:yes gene_type:complete